MKNDFRAVHIVTRGNPSTQAGGGFPTPEGDTRSPNWPWVKTSLLEENKFGNNFKSVLLGWLCALQVTQDFQIDYTANLNAVRARATTNIKK